MTDLERLVRECADSPDRFALWRRFIAGAGVRVMAEIGVFRGAFAEAILDGCPGIERYYLVDPWQHLDDWNKPANVDDTRFEGFYQETLARTAAYAAKRVVLRGRTTEVADQIPTGSLDFVYVDGDHTLRGITIDLTRLWDRVRDGGFIAGDDFKRNIWQHSDEFEPTLVFPYAVYFAEAMGVPIYGLPHRQFLIHRDPAAGFRFVDLTGKYADTRLGRALRRGRHQKSASRQPR